MLHGFQDLPRVGVMDACLPSGNLMGRVRLGAWRLASPRDLG
jgi:hypothetical protein